MACCTEWTSSKCSQNRQEEKDGERAKKDCLIDLKAELELRVMPEKLDHLMRQQAQAAGLKRQLQAGDGPAHTLLADTALSRQLRQSARNVAAGTRKLDQSMEALQHNFLLRGYFKKQAKQRAAATKQ